MDLYGMRVESPKGVKNAEMGHKEIENSRFSCKTRNLSSLHGNKDLKDCSLHHCKWHLAERDLVSRGYELFAMKYPTEFYEAVGPRFGFKSFEKHERAQGIPRMLLMTPEILQSNCWELYTSMLVQMCLKRLITVTKVAASSA
ncbi:unnamed protein product [Arabidopsis thaliana]|uniref:Uncharacterized protein n=1 Tax=Arabidopsis thaliana TaxID=3702 RepID=A0A5S9Y963_ARATH|nr:unnamed protein product [Arabidopsis thaliana]